VGPDSIAEDYVLLDPDERKPKRRKITKFIGVHNCKPVKGVDFSG